MQTQTRGVLKCRLCSRIARAKGLCKNHHWNDWYKRRGKEKRKLRSQIKVDKLLIVGKGNNKTTGGQSGSN